MSIEVKISGIAEVQKSLYSYSQQLGDRVIIASLTQGARVMQRAAKRNAPQLTGRLKRGIVVNRSKIHSAKRGGNTLGVYLTLRKGKGRKDPKDAFYGRFVEDGYNVRGKKRGEGVGRSAITAIFGSRTGRRSLPGKSDVPGKKYMQSAYQSTKEASVQVIINSFQRGAEIVKRKVGLS